MTDADTAWWAWFWSQIEHWAFLAVVVALAIEFAALKLGAPYKEKIEAAKDLKIAELNNETVRLQKQIGPRVISREQRERIIEKMKQFSGQEYSGMVASDVGDAWDLWREISLALELANWRRLPPSGLAATSYGPPAGIPIAPQPGVMILFAASRWNQLHARAQALADAITAEGIAAGPGPASGTVDQKPDALMIVIGPKPQ